MGNLDGKISPKGCRNNLQLGGGYAYPVFFQEIVQGGAADLEEFGGLADVVAAQVQGPADSNFF